jgi:putative MATE family efflux protein
VKQEHRRSYDIEPSGTAAVRVGRPGGRQRSTNEHDLVNGPIARTLWRLAIPLTFGFVINAVHSWINMFFVSRLGSDVIAALGVADQVNFVIFTLGSGFCIGTGIVVARRVGEERGSQASFVATQAFSFMALYSTAVAVIVALVLPMLLGAMQLPPSVLANAETYLLTLLFGFPASLLIFQVNASVRSTGNTVFPMVVLTITALLNVVLDPILIFGMLGFPALGLKGAAIATIASQWIGAIMSAAVMFSGRLNIRLYGLTASFDRELIGSIFRLGVPASMQGLSVSLCRVLLIALANQFGTAAAAAYTLGLRVDVIVFMPIFAAGIAIETLVSQNIGAGRFDRVKAFRQTAIRHLGAVIIAMGAIIFAIARPIADLFSDDPLVISTTVTYLHVAVFGYLFFVVGQSATRSLSGAGHSLRSMIIIAGTLFLVQLPLAYLLALRTSLGITGVFVAITASYLVFAAVATWSIRGRGWMTKKV